MAVYGQLKSDIGKILRQLCGGKSSLMIFYRHVNLKYKYGNRHFWCRGYYVNTADADTHAIRAYIQNQLTEDHALEQMTF